MDNLQVVQNLRNEIKQLKLERLELAEAVTGMVHNSCCRTYSISFRHNEDCIVLKAEKIIKESK